MSNKDENKDDGSVWTSYSDMFTTMAIIFLVMFVFALLRSGIATLSSVKQKKETEEYLKGKIPEDVKKKTAQKKEALKKSINEMQSYENLINQKMVELNQFSKKMKSHQKVIKSLLTQQDKNTAVMARMKEQAIAKNEKVESVQKELKELNSQYNQKSKELSQSVVKKEALIKEKIELKKNIQNWEKKLERAKIVHSMKTQDQENELKKIQKDLRESIKN